MIFLPPNGCGEARESVYHLDRVFWAGFFWAGILWAVVFWACRGLLSRGLFNLGNVLHARRDVRWYCFSLYPGYRPERIVSLICIESITIVCTYIVYIYIYGIYTNRFNKFINIYTYCCIIWDRMICGNWSEIKLNEQSKLNGYYKLLSIITPLTMFAGKTDSINSSNSEMSK